MKYAQLVIGPAGSGKSTYCEGIQKHGEAIGRTIHVVNLDPAAEVFKYDCLFDIRELISVDDLAEDEDDTLSEMGPNGSLVFCMEYIANNLENLQDAVEGGDDEYFLFDCPGQIELYSHMTVMRTIVDAIRSWGFNICAVFLLDSQFMIDIDKFMAGQIELYSHMTVMRTIVDAIRSWGFNICAVFLLDSQFMIDIDKFMAGALTALSTLLVLECSAVCVLSKVDLLKSDDKERMEHILESEFSKLLEEMPPTGFSKSFRFLTEKIANVMDSYSMVSFVPLNLEDEDSISEVLMQIDNCIQYGEDLDVKCKDDPEVMDDDDDTNAWD
uniref:GPN-loop GTPase 3 n=1 Tax=Panagrolaimus sp. JU765 TaxID=591449 RepID=A0AC34R7D6_9BILA